MSSRYSNKQPVTGLLVSYLPNSYRERTSRPIYALVYLLGFLIVFLVGTLIIQPEILTQSLSQPSIRVVAFVWVQNALEFLGFTSPKMTWFASPFVVLLILLALQITSKTPWKVRAGDLFVMAMECIAYSIPLIVLSMLLNRAVPSNAAETAAGTMQQHRLLVDIVTGIGAGIYEELIFRLILICLLMLLFQDIFGLEKKNAVIFSVLISAILFSAHHHYFYVNGQFHKGDVFTIGKFIFRAMAGVYFAILYATRGFGITAGTHAFYNILAALMRMLIFTIQTD